MNFRLLLLLCVLAYSSFLLKAQIDELPQRTALFEYQLEFQEETISYLLSSGGQYEDPRKLVLYLQGSQPIPLFIKQESGAYATTFPADYYPHRADYFFCILPKPGTPAVAGEDTLAPSGMCLDPETHTMPEAYQKHNYLDYYVKRAAAVLEHLAGKLELDSIIVIGGSEGARVGTALARICPLVTHFIYYSADPLGRFNQLLAAERNASLRGETTAEEAEANIEKLYAEWTVKNADPLSVDATTGDTNRAWVSFSAPLVEDLLELEIPVLVAYGTADDAISNMDHLRLEAIRRNRQNMEFKAYPDHDHHLNKVVRNEDGKAVSSEYVFDKIYADWLAWTTEH
ncbi:MAG: hypothetical protein AAFO03_12315 [Bacteroidota bacterium]